MRGWRRSYMRSKTLMLVRTMCDKLNLPLQVRREAERIYVKLVPLYGNPEVNALAVIFAACKVSGIPTIPLVTSLAEDGRTRKALFRRANSRLFKFSKVIDLRPRLSREDTINLLFSYAVRRLGIPPDLAEKCRGELSFEPGRKPAAAVASAIYYGCKKYGPPDLNITKDKVGEVLCVGKIPPPKETGRKARVPEPPAGAKEESGWRCPICGGTKLVWAEANSAVCAGCGYELTGDELYEYGFIDCAEMEDSYSRKAWARAEKRRCSLGGMEVVIRNGRIEVRD